MGIADNSSAAWNNLIDLSLSYSDLCYSMGSHSALEADDILLETAEIMAHSKDFFLHHGPALRLGLV